MKKFIAGFTLAATLGFSGLVFADRVSVPSVGNLQQVVNVAIDFLGLGITDAGPITGSSLTATSTTATSSIASRLQIGTTTAVTGTQLQVLNPKTNQATISTSTIVIGDPVATSTSRSGITMQSSSGSSTCVYVAGTSAPTLVVAAGACLTN